MSKGRWGVSANQVARAVNATRSAGLVVRDIEINRDGQIRLTVTDPARAAAPDQTAEESSQVDGIAAADGDAKPGATRACGPV